MSTRKLMRNALVIAVIVCFGTAVVSAQPQKGKSPARDVMPPRQLWEFASPAGPAGKPGGNVWGMSGRPGMGWGNRRGFASGTGFGRRLGMMGNAGRGLAQFGRGRGRGQMGAFLGRGGRGRMQGWCMRGARRGQRNRGAGRGFGPGRTFGGGYGAGGVGRGAASRARGGLLRRLIASGQIELDVRSLDDGAAIVLRSKNEAIAKRLTQMLERLDSVTGRQKKVSRPDRPLPRNPEARKRTKKGPAPEQRQEMKLREKREKSLERAHRDRDATPERRRRERPNKER